MNRTDGAVRRSLVLALGAARWPRSRWRRMAAPADYPTETLADYVFGCMATNGQTQEALRRCSCSIDAIAGEGALRRLRPGRDRAASTADSGRGADGMFRTSPWAQAMIDKLRQAQVEAELRCF